MRHILIGATLFMLTAAPAQAANPIAARMLSIAKRVGVTFEVAQICGNSRRALATFHPRTWRMCMTQGLMESGKGPAFKTLTHEMVHVAQACLNEQSVLLTAVDRGQLTMKSAKRILNNRISDQDLNNHVRRIVAESPSRMYGLHEAEAYALQRSPQTVLALLESACRDRTGSNA